MNNGYIRVAELNPLKQGLKYGSTAGLKAALGGCSASSLEASTISFFGTCHSPWVCEACWPLCVVTAMDLRPSALMNQ